MNPNIPLINRSGDSADCGASAAATSARPGPPTILILDDDPFMLVMLPRMLQNMGYMQVRTADSGEVGLAIIAGPGHAVDLIICDLNLPGMDGIEFLQTLNASSFRGSVIVLSGEGVRIMHSVKKLLSGGRLTVLGALEKPARPDALRVLLERWSPLATSAPASPLPVICSADLHQANRARQWILHYQPKVDMNSGALTGMEALLRWNHPQHGLLSPDSFIAAAEDCGAIDGLTDWVLGEAMRQLAYWRGNGLKIHMAINVSMENLRAPDFAQRLGALAQAIGVAPQEVTLEITESRLMDSSPAPLESLVRLRLQRFELSIDDFGTGHSSLAQLRDVPFTELKLDRSFVSGARHNEIIRPMLEASIGIARRMGMRLVAEGVETLDDWNFLRAIDCDLAQGYFVSRPMASEQVGAWLEGWQVRQPGLLS
jgi:EAL domain-containing protein (putative c-di-GMP-specific phosphodiesterase class I)/ActR/RegA family two-component response regulator